MNKNFTREPIDNICLFLIICSSIVILILVIGGKICPDNQCLFRTNPHVENFSWQGQKISANDNAFIIDFDRPIAQETVEQNLKIEPELIGRISWAGRRMVFTLNQTITYGRNYRLSIQNAQEKFRGKNELGSEIEPFIGHFSSRDRAFAYIGSQGEEIGKLVLNNSTQENKTILTPDNLTVVDFHFTPDTKKIIFSATDNQLSQDFPKDTSIYEVYTGLSSSNNSEIPGKLKLILDAKDYQNNQFDLGGKNGEIIIVQRIKKDNPTDFDLWKIEEGKIPQKLNVQGGEFTVTPDGSALAVAQGEGISIIPIQDSNNSQITDFLPQYGQVLTFSKDGKGAVMVDFNKDNEDLRYTKSLFYVNNQGVEKELINIQGSIIDCKFSPDNKNVFCLLTELIENGEEFREKPYFVGVNIESNRVIPLLALPSFQDIRISIAPDGFGILFDQLITENNVEDKSQITISPDEELLTKSAELILGSRLWLFTLPSALQPQPSLQELPLQGFNPQWSP